MPTDVIKRTAMTADASMSTATGAQNDALAAMRSAVTRLNAAAVPVADQEQPKLEAERRMRQLLEATGVRFGEPLGSAPLGYLKLTGQ